MPPWVSRRDGWAHNQRMLWGVHKRVLLFCGVVVSKPVRGVAVPCRQLLRQWFSFCAAVPIRYVRCIGGIAERKLFRALPRWFLWSILRPVGLHVHRSVQHAWVLLH